MNIDPKFVSGVERLRKAAKENEVVFDIFFNFFEKFFIF